MINFVRPKGAMAFKDGEKALEYRDAFMEQHKDEGYVNVQAPQYVACSCYGYWIVAWRFNETDNES